MKEWLQIIRPINGIMSSIVVIIVALAVRNYNYIPIIIGMLVAFLTNAGGNVLNDYYDADVDLINHPERPIPSGKIKKSQALIYVALIYSVSLFLSIFLGIIPFFINVIAIIFLYLYESYTKRMGLIGNINISFILLLLFVFSGSIFNKYELPAILGTTAFFATFGREITKDVEDMAGDFNRVTLPKKIGKTNSLFISSIFYVVAILISPIPYVMGYFGIFYVIFVVFADIAFIISILVQFKDPHRGEIYSKYAMIIALLSFIVGGLT
ncbi:MAG: UbiA family prenyltransferase [Thermoplasmata archaeon]